MGAWSHLLSVSFVLRSSSVEFADVFMCDGESPISNYISKTKINAHNNMSA